MIRAARWWEQTVVGVVGLWVQYLGSGGEGSGCLGSQVAGFGGGW